jgi:hypothetical protein
LTQISGLESFEPSEAALSRRSLISAAFRALNRSGTGQLSAMEMRPFAELTGALDLAVFFWQVMW